MVFSVLIFQPGWAHVLGQSLDSEKTYLCFLTHITQFLKKQLALNQVEFTEVQESGNHLRSSTSAEVTYGFQCEFF